jgi:hypothetical protein
VVRFLIMSMLVLAFAPVAVAGTITDRAATALQSDPVYVDPAATTVSAPQVAALRREIEANGHGPIYIAVLPRSALAEGGGSAVGIVTELHRMLDRPGVYAVVAGNQFRAGSTDLDSGEAGKLATQAFRAHRTEGVGPTLIDFVDRVGAARTGGGGKKSRIGFWPIALVGVALFIVYRLLRRRRRAAAEFGAVRETAREDLVALADDVQVLEHQVEGNDAAKRDYLAALDKYSEASSAFDRASSPAQLAPVANALEDGRYLMASAEARLDGKEPPDRRAACFFDPRHGPSVRDVDWAPPGGQPRPVPACAACATRVESGDEPDARTVAVGGQAMPYWAAGPLYGGYFGGFFPGLVLGEIIGGPGWGGAAFGDFGGNGGGDSDGGDFDSGSFDSGDFGGGDFGGDGGGGGDF